MGKSIGPGSFFAMALAAFLAAPQAGAEPSGKGNLLVLHYRWRHDTLSLVESDRIHAALKPSRSRAKDGADRAGIRDDAPRSPFSYEVVSGTGATLRAKYLPDPGVKRVEYQEKGDSQMRQQTVALDSSDFFVEVPEPEAKSIRFFRHGTPGPAAKRAGGASARPGPTALGPEPAPSKTLLAEFPLD
jgi:hypothetical protein